MKKVISLVLVLVMAFSLCACGKSEAVKNVEALIKGIGEVTVEKEAEVLAAEEAYAALSAEEQEKVSNYDVLTAARTALDEAKREAVYAAVCGVWVNVNDMDSYEFLADGSGSHGDKSVEYTVDVENMLLNTVEGASGSVKREFVIELDGKTPKLTPKDIGGFYVEEENYEAIAEEIRKENTAILTGFEYWSNTQGLNYIMFTENGGGWFLLSGVSLGMTWEWVDNNTIKLNIDYGGTAYSSVVTIIEADVGPRLINDQNIVMYNPKNPQ